MLNDTLIERALSWLAEAQGEGGLRRARQAFEEATGAIEEAGSDYEARIAHFLEQHLCEGSQDAIAAFAEASDDLSREARQELAGWLRSHRSLFVFEGVDEHGGRLRDCIGGAVLHIHMSDRDQQLSEGDHFDARVIPIGDRLHLGPGRVYHPREALDALHALLAQVDIDSLPRTTLLNGLLAMRSRYLKFESVRAEHVYQARALAPVHLPLRE